MKRIIFMFLMVGLLGCKNELTPSQWLKNVTEAKSKALLESEKIPYRTQQHQALKEYFSGMTLLTMDLKKDQKFSKKFNDFLKANDLQMLCQNTIIQKRDWQKVVVSCTRNRFFTCSEEVRAYEEVILGLRETLSPDLQKKFDDASCF